MRDDTAERLDGLERKLDELVRRVERLELRFAPSAAPRPVSEPTPAPGPARTGPTVPTVPRPDLEELLGGRVLGWVGGSAIVLGAVFFLVMAVYGTAVDPRFGARLGGLAIGLTIGADILAVGPLTGASMNTARWLGPAIVEGQFPTPIVHLVGPLVGAVVAGALYAYVLMDAPRPRPEPQATTR